MGIAPDITGTFPLLSGMRLDMLDARPRQEQKFICSCLFWKLAGVHLVLQQVSTSEKLLGAGQVPAVQHFALGLPAWLLGSSYNLLAKATGLAFPSREWVQRAVCHLWSPL